MESKAKFLGHPIHPMLIVFPLGLFVMSVVFDIVYLVTGNPLFPAISYYDMIAGIIGGLVAAIFGFRDWLAIQSDTRAKRLATIHGIGNVLIVVLFTISWFMRQNSPGLVPSTLAFLFTVVGVLMAVGTGWLGGELVDRLGVGVYPGANMNASSSISSQPISAPVNTWAAVPVTGEDKYNEKHIEKRFVPDSDVDSESGSPDHPETGPGVERDNLD
jgi:uncharacterized membrane protein